MIADPKINTALVRDLIADQFPQWADLTIKPVAASGWDNRTFHLGDAMIVRMPHAERYAMQPAKEWRWLPYLADHITLPLPEVLGCGEPGRGYPFSWTVLSYLPGDTVAAAGDPYNGQLAKDLAAWLCDLRKVPAQDAPGPGIHNFHRGGDLRIYDQDIRRALDQINSSVNATVVLRVWDKACMSCWTHHPVWLHGDVTASNFLMDGRRLSGGIDFGCCGVGDPACDLTIAWTYFQGDARAAFRHAIKLDDATWARARGWAVWKACLEIAQGSAKARDTLTDVCAEA